MDTWLGCFSCDTKRAPGKRPGDRPSNTAKILGRAPRTVFFRPEPQSALGPVIPASHLTEQDMFRSSPGVHQAPRGILRVTPGGSGPPSVSSAVSTPNMSPSVRTVISNTSNNSDRSAKSLKSDHRCASLQAKDLKANIDELERANRALDPQISHYQHMFSNAESFEKKNKAMQEMKALREQQSIRERKIEKMQRLLGEKNADIQTSKLLLRQTLIAKFDNMVRRTTPRGSSPTNVSRLMPPGNR